MSPMISPNLMQCLFKREPSRAQVGSLSLCRGIRCPSSHFGRNRRVLHLERTTEPTGGIIRIGAVVIGEDVVVAAIAKQGAAEFPDLGRCFHPARRLRIEVSKFL